MTAFLLTGKDLYRKPNPNIFHHYISCYNGANLDPSFLYYIGDAAGRPSRGSRPHDFACTDRAFGLNIKANFQTPEEFFLDSPKEDFHWDSPDPAEFLKSMCRMSY
jgi:DNA 3'-phosphatase